MHQLIKKKEITNKYQLTIATIEPPNHLTPGHSWPEQRILTEILFTLPQSRFHHYTVREHSGVMEEHTPVVVGTAASTDKSSGNNQKDEKDEKSNRK